MYEITDSQKIKKYNRGTTLKWTVGKLLFFFLWWGGGGGGWKVLKLISLACNLALNSYGGWGKGFKLISLAHNFALNSYGVLMKSFKRGPTLKGTISLFRSL